MPIKRGDVIKIQYEVKYDDGKIVDSTEMHGGEPLKIQLGTGQVINGFEESIIGMEVGEEKSFILEPEEAYGEFDPLLVEKIEASQFPADVSLELGKSVDVIGPNGMNSPGLIRLIENGFVIIDMNHPCAGKTLIFDVKILETDLEPEPVVNPFIFGCGCDDSCDHH
ncbi:MAG: peptidylprolyl isomerase [Promethearchaeota archaeon]|nr:MAG: peptidylprolyl isomerase [Candidatus Lokiarchaeota archaeon]